MKFFNCKVSSFHGPPKIEFWGFKEEEKIKIIYDYPIKPYLFIKKRDLSEVYSDLKKIDKKVKIINGDFITIDKKEKAIKIEFSDKEYLEQFLRISRVPSFEGDLCKRDKGLLRRFLIDYKAEIIVPSAEKFLYWDIETDPRDGVPDPYLAEKRIIAICAVDRKGNKYSFTDEDEVHLINKFLWILKKYAAIIDWNGNRFDYVYLKNRCRKLQIFYNWTQIVHIDALAVYKDALKKKQELYTLDHVAEKELGSKKLFSDDENFNIVGLWNWFQTKNQNLIDYCMQDADLVRRLDEKFELAEVLFTMASVSHNTVSDLVIYPKREYKKDLRQISFYTAIDSSILAEAEKEGVRQIFPTVTYDRGEESFTGPLVFNPQPGIHKNVVVSDFRAMHLSIIDTFNMGLDTFCLDKSGDFIAPHGSFKKDPKSLYRVAIEKLRGIREKFRIKMTTFKPGTDEWKTWYSKQFGVKQLTLSLFGVFGYSKGRHYRLEIAEDITLICQVLQTLAKGSLEKRGYNLIYGDTDSVFYRVPSEYQKEKLLDFAEKLSKELETELKGACEKIFKVKNFYLSLEIEKIYSHLFFTSAKKRYFGIVIWKEGGWCEYVEAVGLEMIRKDWPEAARQFQEKLLTLKVKEESKQKIVLFIKEEKNKLFNGELDKKLVIYKGLGKAISAYKVESQHVRAAKKLEVMGIKVRPGDKIGFIIVGEKKEIPVIKKSNIKIDSFGYTYIWKHYYEPLIERAGIDYIGITKLSVFC